MATQAGTAVAARDANELVRSAVEKTIAESGEVGVQVAAYLDGNLVVDVCAGLADETTGQKVGPETIFNAFSVTKGMTATAIHLQAERGLIEYSMPIAEYWPEFGAAGKENVTVYDALTH